MTLSRTGPRTVSSDAGFDVEEQFPARLIYREARRELSFPAELTAVDSPFSILLFDDASGRRWKAPQDRREMDEPAHREILVRVNAALLVLGIRAGWQTLPPERDRDDWPAIRFEAAALARNAANAGV